MLLEKIRSKKDMKYVDYLLPDGYDDRLNGYTGIGADIRFVKEVCEELILNKHSDLITASMWNSLLIIYARCFTHSLKKGTPKLEVRDCFASDKDLIKTHKILMDLRNTLVAHRDENEYEQALAYMKIGTDLKEVGLGVVYLKNLNLDMALLAQIMIVIKHLEGQIALKYNRVASKVYDQLQNNVSPAEMHALKVL